VEAKEEVDLLMSTIDVVPPEVATLYEEGNSSLTAAQAELGKEEPDYGSAISLAREAMSIFREVYEQLDSDAKVQSEMEEQNKGLIEAMSRALIRIDRINGTVYGSAPWLEINKILLAAQDYLDVEEAQDWLAAGRVNETAWNLTQANKLMGLAHSLLKKGGQELKVKRMEHYLDILEKFCDRLQRLAENAGAEDLADFAGVKQLIEDAITALKKEPEPDIQLAMDNLIDARNQLEQIKRELLELRRGKPPAPPERPMPTIDGVISEGEWDEATRFDLVKDGVIYEAYITNDDQFMYVAFDYAVTTGSDFASFNTYKEDAFDPEKITVACVCASTAIYPDVVHAVWDTIEDVDDDGFELAEWSREDPTERFIWDVETATEMKVPLEELGLSSGDNIKTMFVLNQQVGGTYVYPEGADAFDLDTYEDFTLWAPPE